MRGTAVILEPLAVQAGTVQRVGRACDTHHKRRVGSQPVEGMHQLRYRDLIDLLDVKRVSNGVSTLRVT